VLIYRLCSPWQVGPGQAMLPPMSWHVYLLSCADGALYCGVTTEVARRVAEHNAGTASRCTRARLPVALSASAPCADKGSALRLELAVKKRPRADKMAFLLAQPGASLASEEPTKDAPAGETLAESP